MTDHWARDVSSGLESAFRADADSQRAEKMAAYMRDKFVFFGIPATPRKAMQRKVVKAVGNPSSETDLEAFARRSYRMSHREHHYAAVNILRARQRLLTERSLPLLHKMITTHSWWDTVDEIAAHLVGGIVTREPSVATVMDRWIESHHLWLARTALLHQLRFKQRTDEHRLFGYCDARIDETDFFYRKAIGWALREYSKTSPDAVREYCEHRRSQMSPLSLKEATRLL